MDYLQYSMHQIQRDGYGHGFKPYYKWITFNTLENGQMLGFRTLVLNLIINGLPSIPLPKGWMSYLC